MICVVSPNPCMDLTINLEEMNLGELNRISGIKKDLSGKGINVAISARRLGYGSEVVGFMSYGNAAVYNEYISNEGVYSDFVYFDGEVRTNIKLFETGANRLTEINEKGTPVTHEMVAELIELTEQHMNEADLLVLAGSLPPECGDDFYADLIEIANLKGIRCVLDSDGAPLLSGVKRRPYMIKPNKAELSMAVGRELDTVEDILLAADHFINMGVGVVVVSLGAEGGIISDGRTAYLAKTPKLDVKSTIGAGDSMVAAMCISLINKQPIDKVLSYGIAAGSAACITEGTELFHSDDVKALLPRIKVTKIRG